MFTNLPTGSVPLYGAKPPDVSQFKRKKRNQTNQRDKLTKALDKITSFLSQVGPHFSESNDKTNKFLFSLQFVFKMSSRASLDDPTPDQQIENFQEIESSPQHEENPVEEPKQGSLEAIDIPETKEPEAKDETEVEKPDEVNMEEKIEETQEKDEEAEKPIPENSSNSNPVQNEVLTQDTQQEHFRSDSYQSLDNQSAPTRVNDHPNQTMDGEDHIETGKGSLVSSNQAIDEPHHLQQARLHANTQDFIYTNEREISEPDANLNSQSHIAIHNHQSLQQTLPNQHHYIPDPILYKPKSVKSEENLPSRNSSNLSNERKKLQKILDPSSHESEPVKKISDATYDSDESNRKYYVADFTPQGLYKDEFRKMMKQRANYDVTSSFFPIKTEIRSIPKRPPIDPKKANDTTSSASTSGRKVVKKSATTQLKTLDGLPIILEQQAVQVASYLPDSSKTFEPGRRIQNIQLPAIDGKNVIRVPIKKPPKNLIVSQSLNVNNMAFFSQTPQTNSVRVLNFGDNLQLAKKVYSEKIKVAQSAILEKGQLASPQKFELSVKSPKFVKQLSLEGQAKLEPLKNIKIRKIANPNAMKKI